MTVTVATGNVRGNRAAARRLLNLADVACLQEAHRIHWWTGRLTGHDRYVGSDARDEKRAQRETPILYRSHYHVRLQHSEQVSNRVPGAERVAPDRWIHTLTFQLPIVRRLNVVNVHLDAAPRQLRNPDADGPIVREYAKSVRALERHLDSLTGAVVVCGDFNLPADIDVPWNPHHMLTERGLVGWRRHIDGIYYDPRSLALPNDNHHRRLVDLPDHMGMVATLLRRTS